jgi:hypothetical protein
VTDTTELRTALAGLLNFAAAEEQARRLEAIC